MFKFGRKALAALKVCRLTSWELFIQLKAIRIQRRGVRKVGKFHMNLRALGKPTPLPGVFVWRSCTPLEGDRRVVKGIGL